MSQTPRENPTDSPVNIWRNYFLIVAAALGTSVLGALFGMLMVLISPGVVGASATPVGRDFSAAAVVGAIFGLMFGTVVMAFCIVVAVLAIWFRPRNIERHFERERFNNERAERERLELELLRREHGSVS